MEGDRLWLGRGSEGVFGKSKELRRGEGSHEVSSGRPGEEEGGGQKSSRGKVWGGDHGRKGTSRESVPTASISRRAFTVQLNKCHCYGWDAQR